MSEKEILEQEQEVQEETEVQVSEDSQVEEELSAPGQSKSTTDKTNTKASEVIKDGLLIRIKKKWVFI